jgi:type I restriction enzyme M protein
LESHLWGAADILRGSIDSADYKHYIFGLLFFKRLCDVWDEEFEAKFKQYRDKELAADPDEHRFHIPNGHFWADVRKRTTNIGEHLNRAFRAFEDQNRRLQGVFQDVDFNNKERFPDAVLERLLQHFDKHRLRHEDVEADVLGNAYEYLIAKFADDAGKKGGEFYTPKMVVKLLVECLAPEEGMSIYDPTCGSGGMLLEAFHYLERSKRNAKSLSLFGQERNLNTWAICQMNLFLHDIEDASIERGDTLRDPRHLSSSGKALRTFDRVLANPPFSLANWGDEAWKDGDRFGRDKYGCPPKSFGDLAFMQHMLSSLSSKGMLGVVMPHGILFREGAEARIRQGLVKDDLIEAVIGLAPNLFYGADLPTCVLIINRKKPAVRRGKVLFIDGSKEMAEGKNQTILTEENIKRLVDGFGRFENEEGFATVVTSAEIEQRSYNLTIAHFVKQTVSSVAVDFQSEFQKLATLLTQRQELEANLISYLKGLHHE